jgi:uncharacterized coiled-coil DUF342 family protein
MFESKELLKENVSFHESDAKNASKKASEFRNKAEEKRNEVEEIFQKTASIYSELQSRLNQVNTISETVKLNQVEINETIDTLKQNSTTLEDKIDTFESFFEDHPELEDEINSLDSQLSNSKENASKISVLLKSITERKSEIDEIYYEIAGYDEKDDETEEVQHIEGLKDKLEEQYDALSQSLKTLKKDFDDLLKSKTQETQNTIIEWNNKYDSLIKKIETLLPNALTTGLSYAYSKKKDDEIINYDNLKEQFNKGIFGLIAVSSLSVAISLYFIKTDVPFKDVINILPNIASAIIPLYIPVLWYTFSANKKLNLSKRLIEEYTHKEVLGKTFEGLSTQINNLEENEISKDLKLKLLFNILQVSTENPGKLISDYKNTDHPISEILNQQSKLDDAIEKAKGFPGIKSLANFLEESKLKQLDSKKEQIEKLVKDVKEIAES